MIAPLTGDNLGVPMIRQAVAVEWTEGPARVVFSYCRQGNAITAHFAAGKESLRRVKEAVNDFVEWAFWAYPWSEMVFAVIGIKSVERLVKKCGFSFLTEAEGYQVYMRARQ